MSFLQPPSLREDLEKRCDNLQIGDRREYGAIDESIRVHIETSRLQVELLVSHFPCADMRMRRRSL
jgi:hypothetical protein